MVYPITSSHKLTFDEFRFYQGEPDIRYELFRGRLIPMATPTALHSRIATFLVFQLQRYFAAQNLPLIVMTDLSVRTEDATVRIPDLIACSQSLWESLRDRSGAGILDFGETPALVIEITSDNWREDYIRKRAEYALIDIPEYWIIDPNKERIWLLTHPEGEEGYERQEFQRGQTFRSLQFAELNLTVDTILSPPLVEDAIRAEQAQQRQQLEQERQRGDRLAAKLRELGIDPESLI